MLRAATEGQMARARATVSKPLDKLAGDLSGGNLFDAALTVADFYLFVML
jgi:hypothetical protein